MIPRDCEMRDGMSAMCQTLTWGFEWTVHPGKALIQGHGAAGWRGSLRLRLLCVQTGSFLAVGAVFLGRPLLGLHGRFGGGQARLGRCGPHCGPCWLGGRPRCHWFLEKGGVWILRSWLLSKAQTEESEYLRLKTNEGPATPMCRAHREKPCVGA